MSDQTRRRLAHDLDATLRVGKAGIDAVSSELISQLDRQEMVKVKFLRSARGVEETETLATELAELVGASVFQVRGHTAVFTAG